MVCAKRLSGCISMMEMHLLACRHPLRSLRRRGIWQTELCRHCVRGQRREGDMKRSTDRILTTHVGSLVRPPGVVEIMRAKESGQAYDQEKLAASVRSSVREVVQKQV